MGTFRWNVFSGLAAGIGVSLCLLSGTLAEGVTLNVSSSVPVHLGDDRLPIDDALNQVILPLSTPNFAGGQRPPLEVTPGNRFMKILLDHLRLWSDERSGLALSTDQKSRLRSIVLSTRSDLIEADARDLRLVELFEAALTEKRLSPGALASLNTRIGEVEGKEGMRFVNALKEMQAILNEPQIEILRQRKNVVLPVSDVSLTSAFTFADRMLALRWQILMESHLSPQTRAQIDHRYVKARNWLFSLAAEKTVYDRQVEDLLNQPFVDMGAFDDIERKAGPLEGKFWGTFLRIVQLLSPPESLNSR
ncbi:MAG: hypothetical protein ACP5OP_06945 [Leptospirillia bacterium]